MGNSLLPLVGLILGWALARRRGTGRLNPKRFERRVLVACGFILFAIVLAARVNDKQWHVFPHALNITTLVLWSTFEVSIVMLIAGAVGYMVERWMQRRRALRAFER